MLIAVPEAYRLRAGDLRVWDLVEGSVVPWAEWNGCPWGEERPPAAGRAVQARLCGPGGACLTLWILMRSHLAGSRRGRPAAPAWPGRSKTRGPQADSRRGSRVSRIGTKGLWQALAGLMAEASVPAAMELQGGRGAVSRSPGVGADRHARRRSARPMMSGRAVGLGHWRWSAPSRERLPSQESQTLTAGRARAAVRSGVQEPESGVDLHTRD